jgi:spermidine dehydrogenase
MDQRISRRDLLHGIGALAAGTLVPGCTLADRMLALERAGEAASGYPPALSGLRGSHDGSFEVALELALEGRRDWGPVHEPDSDVYDLVVVGGGLSGLAAAHFFSKQKPKARILILDNHDDFGGHARRNEFQVGGRTLIGYGGQAKRTRSRHLLQSQGLGHRPDGSLRPGDLVGLPPPCTLRALTEGSGGADADL